MVGRTRTSQSSNLSEAILYSAVGSVAVHFLHWTNQSDRLQNMSEFLLFPGQSGTGQPLPVLLADSCIDRCHNDAAEWLALPNRQRTVLYQTMHEG